MKPLRSVQTCNLYTDDAIKVTPFRLVTHPDDAIKVTLFRLVTYPDDAIRVTPFRLVTQPDDAIKVTPFRLVTYPSDAIKVTPFTVVTCSLISGGAMNSSRYLPGVLYVLANTCSITSTAPSGEKNAENTLL